MKIIITGGSGGLGQSIIEAFKDHEIVVAGRTAVQGYEHIALDFTDNESVASAINVINTKHQDCQLLINNSGVWEKEMANHDRIDELFAVNATGPIKLTEGVINTLLKNKGTVVIIGSSAAYDTRHTIYSPSKWTARAYARYLEDKYYKTPLRVINFNPGGIKTNFFDKAGDDVDTSPFLKPDDLAQLLKTLIMLPANMEVPEIRIRRSVV